MPVEIDEEHILLDCAPASKTEVIRAIGEVMVRLGEVTPRYVEGMLEKEAQFSTWVTEGVALPHGTHAVAAEVRRSSVVLAQIPGGVDWGEANVVRVAIGLAGRGDERHLAVLSSLAEILQHPEVVDALARARHKKEVARLLAGREAIAK